MIDFGIARVLVGSASAGLPMGTLRYMPPERYRGEPGDGKADVWAWGAVVLFAATGRDAFDGDNPAALASQVTHHRPDTSGLEEPLRSLVDAALSKNPGDRPTSEELLLSLVGRADLAAAVKAAEHGGRRGPREPSRAEIAEAVFGWLDPEAQEAVSAVLLRLVAPGERAEDTLRSARRAEFADDRASDEAIHRILREFTASGILVWDGDTVTLSSAALIRSWPRLRAWVDAERDGLAQRVVHHRRGCRAARRGPVHAAALADDEPAAGAAVRSSDLAPDDVQHSRRPGMAGDGPRRPCSGGRVMDRTDMPLGIPLSSDIGTAPSSTTPTAPGSAGSNPAPGGASRAPSRSRPRRKPARGSPAWSSPRPVASLRRPRA
ncbi:nSTAND1 domain-containing NTPase [Yinghuangia sp. ASG 101]|uniref:nSTAND1 domain-containing NTPase n=1 Tax=Yinghuangia sp. ASG 101 TaxID=2896848 RepID=UPI003FCE94A1